jgi:TonB-linked SusC/RagA family outer membrane protein
MQRKARSIVIFLLAALLQVSATVHAQEKISLSEKNAPLEKVFADIQKQTSFNIWFDKALLDKTSRVDINLKDVSIEQIMTAACTGQPLEFSIVGKNVVVRERATKQITDPPGKMDVTGKVVNENGEAVSGVSVLIKGSRNGTRTEKDGSFSLTGIDEDAMLVITGTNVETQEVKINHRRNLLVLVKTRISKLDDVQIIGYGQTTQRLNTGNVNTVKAETIAEQPVANPLAALEGRVPGLVITQATGVPGGAFTILLRGQNSIANGNTPLYIIDGVPFPSAPMGSNSTSYQITQGGNPLSSINPLDIEQIEILKDADATAIYGSRGANGVILITTKKGISGKAKLDIHFYSGTGSITRMMHLLNTPQYLAMRHEAFRNDGASPDPTYDYDLTEWDTTRNTDWQKMLIGGTSHITDATANVSGGNSSTQFLLGSGFHRETTVFPGDEADQRISLHFNLTHASQDKKLLILFSANYTSENNNLFRQDLTGQALSLAPDAPPLFDKTGKINWPFPDFQNPLAYLNQEYTSNTATLLGNATFAYQLTHDFQIKADIGYTNIQLQEYSTRPASFYNPIFQSSIQASSIQATNFFNSWIAEPQINYHHTLLKGNITVLIGSTFQENNQNSQTVFGSGYTSDDLIDNISAAPHISILQNNIVLYRYNALFGRIHYNLRDEFLLSITGRRDGSSRFGPGKQWANFGAVGAAWIFSKENFFLNHLPVISLGKLRGSYGITGNDQIPDYGYLDTYSPTQFSYNNIAGLIPTRLPNADYSWETNKKLELGFEFGLWKDRFLGTVSWYRNQSSNQLVGYPLPLITGGSSIQANLPALIENTGLEMEGSYKIIATGHVSWTTALNMSIPKNKLVFYPNIAGSSYAYKYVVGKPLGIVQAFHYTGVDPQKGIYTYQDLNKDGQITFPEDLTSYKKIGQDFYGGWLNTLTAGNWQLTLFFQFVKQTGYNYISNRNVFQAPGNFGNQPTVVLSRWQKPGDHTDVQQFTQGFGDAYQAWANAVNTGDNSISDASFIRLKNLFISYHLPSAWVSKCHLTECKIFLQCQNLVTITKYLGMDPENQSFTSLPPLKVISAGIQVTL